MSACVFYLRKNHDTSETIEEFLKNAETVSEYIRRKSQSQLNADFYADINFHLYQLIEIACDCRLAYEWLSKADAAGKKNFFIRLNKREKLAELLNYRKYHFTQIQLDSLGEDFIETVEKIFDEIIDDFWNNDITYINKVAKNDVDWNFIKENDLFINYFDDGI